MPANVPFFLLQPFKWRAFITDRFNAPRNYTFAPHKLQKHEGLDYAPTRPFTAPLEVLAGQRGVVTKVAFNQQGYGNYVRIDHDWNGERWVSWYGHLEKALVAEGTFVSAGDLIGHAGNTGFSTGIHLHLTLQRIGKGLAGYVVDDVVDPEPFLQQSLTLFDEASWAEDVTFKDGAPVQPGQTFRKTWRLRNTGSKPWVSGYTLAFSSGDKMGSGQPVPLPAAKPGEVVTVSVDLKAPTAPGTYRSTWKAKNAQGQFFDFEQWAEISVSKPDMPTPTPTGRNEAGWVDDITVEDGTVMRPGERFVKTWRIENKGTTAWGNGYQMAFFSGEKMSGPDSVPLPAAAPGAKVNVSIPLVAPSSPGVYRSTWKPRSPDGKFFDHEQWAEIKVVGEALSNEATLIAGGFSVAPGATFIKAWRVRNTGQAAWGAGYSVFLASGERMGAAESAALTPAQPGQEVVIALAMVAPEAPGLHRGTWRLRGERGDVFGPALEAVIFVTPG